MFSINKNYTKLNENYFFSTIAKKVNLFKKENPNTDIIRMGIGDVTLPLTPTIISALHKSVDEMANKETFKGYGPEQGYDFLLEKIATFDFQSKGINISKEEIFIGDGAKSDTGNIGDILGNNNIIAITNPVYPVYVDTNIMRINEKEGEKSKIVFLPCDETNGFLPNIPDFRVDIIYLCYPNNPTGTVMTKDELKKWVNYALQNNSLILFDAAYEAFISDDNIPHSIFEIEGANKCAIEFRSYSKNAGFTGLRCSYTVVPKELKSVTDNGEEIFLNKLWNRRQSTKFNGTPYIVQKAAESFYSIEGQKENISTINYYKNNAKIIYNSLKDKGFKVFGGTNSPYVWLNCMGANDSWDFFDKLLKECQIVGTPGVGFGSKGEGYFRLTGFNSLEATKEAMQRITNWNI